MLPHLRRRAFALTSTTLDDQLELLESIIFHFWVVMSWSKIFALIFSPDSGDDDTRALTQIGFGVAIGLLALEAFLALKYLTNMQVST